MKTESPIYNIPIDLIEAYRGRQVIVRVFEPAQLVDKLSEKDLENLYYVQVLTLAADISALGTWGLGLPVDLVMYEPEAEFAKLYNHAKLLDKHPVRVTIPVRPGFVKAVKIAGSVGFAVKISVGQPSAEDLAQLFEVLDMFLHKPAVAQPIEFFQGSMQSFFRDDANTVWAIQEEDPSKFRFISTNGKELAAQRFVGAETASGRGLDTFIDDFLNNLLSERRECSKCEFVNHCRGYFKWPNKDYLCAGGVIELFRELKSAAGELQDDLAAYSVSRGGQNL